MSKKPAVSAVWTKIRPVVPHDPQPERVAEAARIIKAGGVVVFPARSLYGLGADAFLPDGVRRVFAIKRRPLTKPLPLLIERREWLSELADRVPSAAEKIMEAFWPGKVTIIFPAKADLPEILTGGSGKVGLRIPGSPTAALLVKLAGRPITATSANLSGLPACHRISDLDPAVMAEVDLVLDAQVLKGGAGSTVIDVTAAHPRILREGEIKTAQIARVLEGRGPAA